MEKPAHAQWIGWFSFGLKLSWPPFLFPFFFFNLCRLFLSVLSSKERLYISLVQDHLAILVKHINIYPSTSTKIENAWYLWIWRSLLKSWHPFRECTVRSQSRSCWPVGMNGMVAEAAYSKSGWITETKNCLLAVGVNCLYVRRKAPILRPTFLQIESTWGD